ncbi:MAG: Ig-like domain-containing protein, partial [Clostridia bacterium]|nr:Ig-like domain-containing protein [Clostridia bacterium]
MRKMLKRALALTLTVAMVTVCCLSGLILPAAAGDTAANLLEGKTEASYTMAGGDTPLGIRADVSLKANTRYAVRVTVKSTAKATISFPDISTATITVLATAEWRTYQAMFTMSSNAAEYAMKVTFAGTAATDALELTNIELMEAPADGTFNLLPASDSNTQSSFLSECFKKGLPIEADPDNPSNAVLHFTSDAVYAGSWDMSGIDFTSGKILKLTFKLKGGALRIDCGDSRPVYLPNPDATSIGGNGKYTYYKTDEWTECSYYIKPSAADQIQYFVLGNRSSGAATELWLDDIRLYEVTEAAGIQLSSHQLVLPPDAMEQLTVRTVPGNGWLTDSEIVWSSDDEDVVKVDQSGMVIAVGEDGDTATVTATTGNGFTDSCTVTIDGDAQSGEPKSDNLLDGKVEPSYTMHGGDAANAHNALVVLRANTRYALRVTAQADAAASIAFPGVASETIAVSATDEWRTYQVMFTPAALILNFKMQVTFATADAAHTLQYQNIELLEAPADGTFNLLPASDSNTQSSFLSECF